MSPTKPDLKHTQPKSSSPLSFLNSLPQATWIDVSTIGGNVSPEEKQLNVNAFAHFVSREHVFGSFVGRRFQMIELNVYGGEGGERDKKPTKEGVGIVEITVEKDMANPYGILHGACAAYIVDLCSSVPLIALGIAMGIDASGMSQSMDLIWHAPAPVGTRLRIVGTSLSIGGRIMASRCEIYNKKTGILCVSATHTKINPFAKPKSKPKPGEAKL